MTNDRGQAFIESLFLGIVIVIAITYSLRFALRAQKKFAMDEYVEESLICLVENKSTCISDLRSKLTNLGYQSISIQNRKSNSKWFLSLKAISNFGDQIEKESELEYDLKVQI